MVGQEGRQVGGGGVGVVAADGVQHVDAVGGEPVGRRLQRVDSFGDQSALDQVGRVGELDPRVADRRSAVGVQQARRCSGRPA